jgi:hypothetical protein
MHRGKCKDAMHEEVTAKCLLRDVNTPSPFRSSLVDKGQGRNGDVVMQQLKILPVETIQGLSRSKGKLGGKRASRWCR